MLRLSNIIAFWSPDEVRRVLHEIGTILATVLSIFTLFVAWDAKRRTRENKGTIDELQVKHETNESDIKSTAQAAIELAQLVPKDTTKVEHDLKAIITKPPTPPAPAPPQPRAPVPTVPPTKISP